MTPGKAILIGLVAVIFLVHGEQSLGEAELKQARELYVSRGCIACHQNPELTKAPPLTAVSKKYATDEAELAQIKTSLAKGSIGKWGALEMPPQAHLSDKEQDLLARWVLGLHAAKEKPPLSEIDASWSKFAYHGAGSVAVELNPATQELSLRSQAGVAGFRFASKRGPADPVSLTLKQVSAAGKPWGQVGLMISAIAEPQLLGSGPKYEWIIRRETNGKDWDYRVRKDVGTGKFELYSSGPIDPTKPVKLEIVRNGDNYEFRANDKLHYTTGDNVDDLYSSATKNSMVHHGITIGGSHAFEATLVGLPGAATMLIPASKQADIAPTPMAPPGDELLIERRKGNVIEIADKPLVYRTYLHGIPSRAITVGLPNKTSYAFDADGCRLAFAWSGGFLDVTKSWTGFGGWYSKLLGQKFYEAPAGFPLRIGDPGKAPKPQFRGYDIENDLPTFKYLVDGQLLRHRITVSEDGGSIAHTFALPDNTKPVYFVGNKTDFASADAVWKDGRWSIRSEKRQEFSIKVLR